MHKKAITGPPTSPATQSVVAPNQTAYNTYFTNYQNKLRSAWPQFKIVFDNIPALNTTEVYEDPQPLVLYLQQLKAFWELLNGKPGTSRKVLMPEFPQAENVPEQYQTKYDAATTADENMRNLMRPVFDLMRSLHSVAQNAIRTNESWVSAPQTQKQISLLPKAVEVGRFLGLTTLTLPQTATPIKVAYPMTYSFRTYPFRTDIEKWKKIATQINAFGRAYKDYTFPQVLYHFTSKWDMFERYRFKKWYSWMHRQSRSEKKMEKFAQSKDFVVEDRIQKFEKKRKLLLSRINLVRKALHDLINSRLIPTDNGNKIYKILSMLEYEAIGLAVAKVASARTRRASKQLTRLGFLEGSSILHATAQELLRPDTLVKTAEEENGKKKDAIEILKSIKKEMDLLNYSRHLDAMYHLKKELEEMGRQNDADSVLKIIREDLDGLDKIQKKLTEVYTNLSKIPIQLSEDQDVKMREPKEQKVAPPALEVTEEEAMPKRPERQQRPARPARPAVQPAPKLQTEIPNV